MDVFASRPPAALATLSEHAFLLSAVRAGLRPDGRSPIDVRNPEFYIAEDEFSVVRVHLGESKVVVSISAQVVRPSEDRPTDGVVQYNVRLSPTAATLAPGSSSSSSAAAAGGPGRVSNEEIVITRTIEKALRGTRAIDTESLCILSGEKAWALQVDLLVLDNDGNLLDCAFLATITALLHFRRPKATVRGQEHTLDEGVPIPLTLTHIPLSLTFAFFEEAGRAPVSVLDPSLAEERYATATLVVTMNQYEEVCCLTKMGGSLLTQPMIEQCLEVARHNIGALLDRIKAELKISTL